MPTKSHGWLVVLLLAPVWLRGAAAPAQTNAETNAPWVQFNLSVPGARSLGLGGAFVGLADDATTAYANPAGLALLPGVEASVELRSWNFDHVFTRGGNLETSGAENGKSSNATEAMSFGSFLYGGRGWGVAVYSHRVGKFEADFETNGLRLRKNRRLFPSRIRHRLDIENFGISVGKAWRELDLSVGIGIAFYRFEMDSLMERFSIEGLGDPAPEFTPENLHDRQLQVGSDEDAALLLGLLYWPNEKLRFGASYRGGGKFGLTARSEPGNPLFGAARTDSQPAAFQLPAVLGVGLAYMPHRKRVFGETGEFELQLPRRWKVALDLYLIEYSVLGKDIVDVFFLCSADAGADSDPGCQREATAFEAEDGLEVHLGVETQIGRRRPLFLRFGSWLDPSHALEYKGSRFPAFIEVFRPGEDIVHYSVGFGTSGYRYQVDAALDVSKRITTFSLSSVVRF